MKGIKFFVAAALLASCASVVHAQQIEATVSGQVVDETGGAPLAGAGVAVLDDADVPLTGAVTDAEGQFTITGLTPGEYQLSISQIGYTDRTTVLLIGELNSIYSLGALPLAPSVEEVVITGADLG
jgi:hypothetical protein